MEKSSRSAEQDSLLERSSEVRVLWGEEAESAASAAVLRRAENKELVGAEDAFRRFAFGLQSKGVEAGFRRIERKE